MFFRLVSPGIDSDIRSVWGRIVALLLHNSMIFILMVMIMGWPDFDGRREPLVYKSELEFHGGRGFGSLLVMLGGLVARIRFHVVL